MKFQRWNEEKQVFEYVKVTTEEYEELILGFGIAKAEMEIEDLIELMKDYDDDVLKKFIDNKDYD
tara:strand:+ start:17377 stop:17571 length:195 start_codon:yes stop_codon:yes gene_type:complete